MDSITLSVSIVNYNDAATTVEACQSILKHTVKYPLRLYVIDNGSADGDAGLLQNLSGVELIQLPRNIGFGAAHNQVLSRPLGTHHFVVNPDITVASDVLSDLADVFAEHPDLALAMPRIMNDDGTEQHLPKEVPTLKRMFLGRLPALGGPFEKIRREYTWADKPWNGITDVDFCSGCFMAIPSENLQKLGGFDERFFMYLEDADLTLRAKALGRTVFVPQIEVVHHWKRESAKNLKCLFYHVASSFKFVLKRR